MLSSLKSSLVDFDFNIDNWQSKIRQYANIHANYIGLRNWDVKETSDIVYNDVKGVFTTFLIDKGYLSKAGWQGRTPKYYIEVKTTTEQCKKPFFVSKGQFKRVSTMLPMRFSGILLISPKMRESTNGASGNQNQSVIYTVFRVYNLGKNTTALKIYIDPEEHRRTNTLRFSEEGWTVVPSVGS